MYCPRCGSANTETIKFCRQCGLPLAQITGYVATGGTGALTPPPQPAPQFHAPVQLPETAEMLALKQKRILTMMCIPILPVILTIALGDVGGLIAIPYVLIPIALAWAQFRYKTQLLQLQERQLQQYLSPQPQGMPATGYAALPPQAYPAAPQALPAAQPAPLYQAPAQVIPTNPLAHQQGSVIEDETRRLPDQR